MVTHTVVSETRRPRGYRWFTSVWTAGIVNLVCVVVATVLYYVSLAHAHTLADDCGTLVKMPQWCDVGFRVTIAVSALMVVVGLAGPAWRKRRGEAATIDAVTGALFRVVVAVGIAVYAYLMYHASAPYHVPCS